MTLQKSRFLGLLYPQNIAVYTMEKKIVSVVPDILCLKKLHMVIVVNLDYT